MHKQLDFNLVMSNSQLCRTFLTLKSIYPATETPRKCGEEYDTRCNKLTSANRCRREHDVEKNVHGTRWVCNECGQTWVREDYYCIDTDDLGYCLHEGPHSEESDPDGED